MLVKSKKFLLSVLTSRNKRICCQLYNSKKEREMLKMKLKKYCVLDELGISRSFIICQGFYTTSVDTGLRNGIVVRLEKEFGHQLLQLLCRLIFTNYSARLRQNWLMMTQKVQNRKHSILLLQNGPD